MPTPTTPRPLRRYGFLLALAVGALWQAQVLTYQPTPLMTAPTDLCATIDTSRYLGPGNEARAARRQADLEVPASERYARLLERRQQQPTRAGLPR